MSQLRQNIATREWVVIAPERLMGEDLQAALNPLLDTHPDYHKTCPFCPGNRDERFKPGIDRINYPDCGTQDPNQWRAICIENLYKIVAPQPGEEQKSYEFEHHGIYHKTPGTGNHELIIESDKHNLTFATMPIEQVVAIAKLYHSRFNSLSKTNRITIIFKNHGTRSGASQRHPHSQIVGLKVVPGFIRFLLEQARRYFDAHGVCVFCKILEYELKAKERVVYTNDKFISFVPYAASVPYEVHILPKQHNSLFGNINHSELQAFSDCLRNTMRKLYVRLSNPDFNFVFRNPPYSLSDVPFYHWHMQIIPYLRTPGGFELGSGMHANVVAPEEAASELRGVAYQG